MSPPRFPPRTLLLLGLLALLGSSGAFLGPVPSALAADEVEVPDVLGQEVERAAELLARRGLDWRLIGPEKGEGRRIVTAQNPRGGEKARPGAQVRLVYRWVEAGQAPPSGPDQPRDVTVPRVMGLDLERAARRLQDAGLGARFVPEPAEGTRGLVLAQNPTAGRTVRRGTVVRLTWRRLD